MTFVEGLKKMKYSIEKYGQYLEQKFLTSADRATPPPSPITALGDIEKICSNEKDEKEENV